MSNDIDHVLFTAEQLSERVAQLGAQITADYADNDVPPLVICILRGAATFASDLVRAIDLPIEIDYMAISSYGAATRSSGILRIVKDLDTEIKDVVGYGLDYNQKYRNLPYVGVLKPELVEG